MTTKTIRLISFDIGIKNMAYCIFDINPNEMRELEIVDWNILNLSSSSSNRKIIEKCTCCISPKKKSQSSLKASNKNNTNIQNFFSSNSPKTDDDSLVVPEEENTTDNYCGKKAIYKKHGTYYCSLHAKKSDFVIPTKEHSLTFLKKQKISTILEIENKIFVDSSPDSSFNPKTANKLDRINRIMQYYSSIIFDDLSCGDIKEIAANKLDLIDIGRNMNTQLSRLSHLDSVTHVIIENQISPIANRMKTIQGMLAQFFIIKNVPNIIFISSSNKLKDFSEKDFTSSSFSDSVVVREPELEKPKRTKSKKNLVENEFEESGEKEELGDKKAYKQNKNNGVTYCRKWLESDIFRNTIWPNYFEEFPQKKDDLADSFLQGIWFIRNKIINNADNLKINNVYLA
jgi:hypothetical protein